MADISTFQSLIKNSKRGEVVRDSITNAINVMDRDGISAETLNGHKPDFFAKTKDVNNALLNNNYQNNKMFLTSLSETSLMGVESNGVFWGYKRLADKLDELLGED